MKYQIGTTQFKTKKEITNYYKTHKDNIGLIKSLKNIDLNFYNNVIELFKYHLYRKEKLHNLKDIKLDFNQNKDIAFFIIYNNNSVDDISYIHCIANINRTQTQIIKSSTKLNLNLNNSLRYQIKPQIQNYKNNNLNKICQTCDSTESIEVDHIIFFKQLVDDFLLNRNDIPNSFDEHPILKSKMGKKKNINFFNEWDLYHEENCELQYLCKLCNLKKKPKKT